MTAPCGCLCLPNPSFVDCIPPTPITQGNQTCLYDWRVGVINSNFSPYAPIRWTLGYSPSGSASPTTTLYPVVSGSVLAASVWESDSISQDGGTKVFYFRLTIGGLDPGQVKLEMVFTAHPISGFPSTIEFVNKVHLGQTIQGDHKGLCFPLDWIEANYAARQMVVDRFLIDFPCCFHLYPVPLRTYLPGTVCTAVDMSYECTGAGFSDPAGEYVGQTFTGSCTVPSGTSVYTTDNFPYMYGALYAANGKFVSTSCLAVVNCNSGYGTNGTVSFLFGGVRTGSPSWFDEIFPFTFSGGANAPGGFNPTFGNFTVTGVS